MLFNAYKMDEVELILPLKEYNKGSAVFYIRTAIMEQNFLTVGKRYKLIIEEVK